MFLGPWFPVLRRCIHSLFITMLTFVCVMFCLQPPPQSELRVIGILSLTSTVLVLLSRNKRATHDMIPKLPLEPLDKTIENWTKDDMLLRRHILRSVLVLGVSGSGKTSGSGQFLGHAIIGDRFLDGKPAIGGLVIGSKPEELQAFKEIFTRVRGNTNDLLVFSLDSPLRCNFIECIGGDARNVTNFIMTVRASQSTGEDQAREAFWEENERRTIHGAAEICRLAYGRITAPSIHRFLVTSATSIAQLSDEHWQAGFHFQTLQKAFANRKTDVEHHDYELYADQFLGEWPQMADKTRSSIVAGVSGCLHIWNSGIVRKLVSEESNVKPEIIEEGKWLFVDMGDDASGRFVKAGMKYVFQQYILGRKVGPGTPLACLWMDEFQKVISSEWDAGYLAECRSHLGFVCALTQSINSIYAAMKGRSCEAKAKALLSNFGTHVVHTLDPATAEYASSLIGKHLETFIGGSIAPANDAFDEVFGRNKIGSSFSQSYQDAVQPRVFQTGLRSGGNINGKIVDGIVIRAEPFSTGNNWILKEFHQ
jgi:hypothetical protein